MKSISKLVTEINPIQLGERAVMFGKRSGPTLGVVSAADSKVGRAGLPGTTIEYVVTGVDNEDFAKGGDSGTFVLDSTGALVGLLWGGPIGEQHEGPGYVTPILEVIKDIEERTGYKVRLPEA